MASGVFYFLFVVYMVLGIYIYHSMFTVVYLNMFKQLTGEIIGAIAFSAVMTSLTLLYYIPAMIIIIVIGIILGMKAYDPVKRRAIIIAFVILGVIIAITGYSLKKSKQKSEKQQDKQVEKAENDLYEEDNTDINISNDSLEEKVNTDESFENEPSESIIEDENIFVFYNSTGDSMIALGEYNTPASDGAIGEVIIAYNDEVSYTTTYYLDTSGTSCWAEDYEVLYYFYDEQDFIQYLGITLSEEGAIMEYNSEYRNNDIYYEMIE